MKQTVFWSVFIDAFRDAGRLNKFGYDGLRVLFDWLEQYEQTCGDEIDLGVVALCCEYSRDSWDSIAESYNIDLSDCKDDDERMDVVRDYLEEHTLLAGQVGESDFIYQNF